MPETHMKLTAKAFATEHAPAPDGGMKRYGRWTIDIRMYDASINEIDAFTCRQDLWTGKEGFVVRLTREDDGSQFEDRGTVKGHLIDGVSGFGGKLSGRLLQNNSVFLEGKGGAVDFVLVANPDWTGSLSMLPALRSEREDEVVGHRSFARHFLHHY